MQNIILSAKNLSTGYANQLFLENINLQIPESSYVAVVGPNGSGKTTFLKTILGLKKNYTGELLINNEKPENVPSSWIGYVPQIKTIDRSFPALPIELVASGIKKNWVGIISKAEKEAAMEILTEVGADSYAYKSLEKLSGGQLQRVFLARSLVRKPKILLLDEPATGIDLVCEISINSLINQYNKKHNVTVIMVTHDWSAAYHHTNYVLLLNKKQVYFGDSKSAFTDENLQNTFSHSGHHHDIKFGMKELANA